ncbi:DNA polymerase Y family protein [Nakamurella deserti]|uniref:DNA polymerase Y family protein n=1 Tax=Nakamurella deserti TaxID=2164074 RepID=UPI000DBE1055|nr:DNA polymerase Y family protein [Nakamurella deserti]
MTRSLVVWCPDWPVVTALKAAGRPTSVPAAVFVANRVTSSTAAARREGVIVGMRRREAQSRCPGLLVLKADPERDARDFEPIAAVVEELAPGLEILRPGLLGCPARGPARYFRSEGRAAETIVDAVEALDVECRIGVADSLEVAVLASRLSTIVPPGESATFCAPLPIAMLAAEASMAADGRSDTVDLLQRLGITTFADFAALPDTKVATRFGPDAVAAHRLSRGLGERPVSRREIPADLTVEQVCDPPLDRVDTAAFAARSLAERFHQRLADAGLACTRLMISARTELDRDLTRTWRCAAPLTPAATADRLRWQLDGWLTASRTGADGPGAITLLRLEPVEAVGAGLIQYGLWGSEGESDQRAGWALARIQGLLGPAAVLSPAPAGGRSPDQRIALIPWGQEQSVPRDPTAPWPGRLPAPSPTRLLRAAQGVVALRDDRGHDVTLTDRGRFSTDPRWCVTDGGRTRVLGWAGPWMLDEQWWERPGAGPAPATDDPGALFPVSATAPVSRAVDVAPPRRARVQLELADGAPVLLGYLAGGWAIEGVYD